MKEQGRHTERCSECKNILIDLFRKLYGEVKIDHKIEIPARIEKYKGTKHYKLLNKVYAALITYRKHRKFVRINTLHRCDLYIPKPGFIVEFDESQHFSKARIISLNKYPSLLKLGFSKRKWIRLCSEINAKDNDPPFRDEQRAWYDTLRDFLPLLHKSKLKPTVRIFMKEFKYCELNPNKKTDIKIFKNLLKAK